jgi:hypothetical protein
MIPYLDAGFLLTLLLRVQGNLIANGILRELEPPFPVNSLHYLQVESFLMQLKLSAEPDLLAATQPELTWKQYLSEGVFQDSQPEWERAFALARQWNERRQFHPMAPLLVLHPALALLAQSTHFLSFDPRSRAVAQAAGLKLLPLRL